MKKYVIAISSMFVFFVLIGKLPFMIINFMMLMLMALSLLIYLLATLIQITKEFMWIPKMVMFISAIELLLGIAIIKKISSADLLSGLFHKIGSLIIRENLYVGMIVLSLVLIVQTILLNWVSAVFQNAQQVKEYMSQHLQVNWPHVIVKFLERKKNNEHSFHSIDIACYFIRCTTYLTIASLIVVIVLLIFGQFNVFINSIIGLFMCFSFIHVVLCMGMETWVSRLAVRSNAYEQ